MTTERATIPPAIRILLVLAASVITLGGLWLAKGLVGPLAIAAVIVIICYPLGPAIARAGAPKWVGSTGVILLGYVVLAILALLLTFAITEFVRLITDLLPELTRMMQDVYTWLGDLGVDASIGSQISAMFSTSRIVSLITSLSGSVMGVAMAMFFILAYVIFMSIDAARYSRAEQVFGPQVRPVLERMRSYCVSVRRYFVVNASFGLLVAVVDTIALYILDVPAPLVWGILAFVTNFVPNIGFVLGLVPPAVIALVTNDWVTALIVVVVYIVVNVTLQVLIQPKFISDAVGLTLTLSFFSVVFWTFVIGPLGAILAVPLTLLVRTLLLEGDPASTWLRWLSGDDDAVRNKPAH
ncbi:MAG: AI-2E family transporter [Microbacterium gubbeenense]|uniref:AI-2E family transporter n=1 Tax=Microbacterium gubbeenense TaxID=159896 RepID=UPI003F94863C